MWVSVPPVEVTMANTGEQNHLRCSQPLKPHTEWKHTTRDPQETCTHLYGHLEARWDNSENLMSLSVSPVRWVPSGRCVLQDKMKALGLQGVDLVPRQAPTMSIFTWDLRHRHPRGWHCTIPN